MLYLGLLIGLLAGFTLASALRRLFASDIWSLVITVLESNLRLRSGAEADAPKLKVTPKSA